MKAARFHSFGGPDVLVVEDIPEPAPQPDDVVVRVHAAGLNPIDCKVRSGSLRWVLRHPLPFIASWDFSGIVESVGAAVTRFAVGDEVFGCSEVRRHGAGAEFLAVKAALTALKPSNLDHIHAAAVPLAGLTAWQALFDSAALAPGQRVLIHAAAGGVGHFAVQLAKWRGAYVVGTGSARNRDFVRSLGADEFVDYQSSRFEDVVGPVDLVVDALGGEVQRRSWGLLKPGGRLVSLPDPFVSVRGMMRLRRASALVLSSNGAQLRELGRLIEEGHVSPHVERAFPLEQAAEGHRLLEAGHVRGKLVLEVRPN